jgi:hypothetical protein
MEKQRGGSFTVSGYIALALLALATVEAVYVTHLLRHRVIQIVMPHTPPAQIRGIDI